MSDFQIGMILAGVAIVGGVFGLNWWQERSFRRKAEQAFEKPAQDVLLEPKPKTAARASSDTQRLEPSLSMPLNPATSPRAAMPQAPVPGADNTVAASRVDPVLESVVDFIADFVLVEPVPAHKLLVAIEDAGQLGKPVRWMGLIDGEGWQPITPGSAHSYSQIRAGLQLADRKGPLAESQLLEFVRIVHALAADIGANVELPQRQPALQAAGELDAFCAEVDVLIGLNIVSRDGTPFPATKIRSLCEAAGMELADDGLFHYRNENGQTLFSMCNLGQESFSSATMRQMKLNAVTLLFDVPRVAGGISVFERVATLAKHLAESVDGELVDDNRRPLNEQGLGSIKRQLTDIYNRMQLRGIEPGSPLALRLFA